MGEGISINRAKDTNATFNCAEFPKAGVDFLSDGTPFLQGADGVRQGRFVRASATLTSAAAATAVNIIPDSLIGAAEKVYLISFLGKVNGATNWATTATIKLQDTNGTPVDFVTITINASTTNGNVVTHIGSNSNVALNDALVLATGGTAGKGLQVKGNANGTGSDYVVSVLCWIGP